MTQQMLYRTIASLIIDDTCNYTKIEMLTPEQRQEIIKHQVSTDQPLISALYSGSALLNSYLHNKGYIYNFVKGRITYTGTHKHYLQALEAKRRENARETASELGAIYPINKIEDTANRLQLTIEKRNDVLFLLKRDKVIKIFKEVNKIAQPLYQLIYC